MMRELFLQSPILLPPLLTEVVLTERRSGSGGMEKRENRDCGVSRKKTN